MDTAVTASGPARRLVPGLLAPVATVVVAAAGLRVSGLGVIDAIGFALVIAWAIAAAVLARAADRTAYWLIALGALGAIGARAGGASVLPATIRVLVWGGFAMAVTMGVGRVFGTPA